LADTYDLIGGPGAFVLPAHSYESFGDVLKKLITEIAAITLPAPDPRPARKR
jgi:hypothetical protein